MSRTHIFLSYSTKDEDAAKIVKTELKNRGIDCFFAPDYLRTGNFLDELKEKLKSSDAIIALLSQNFRESDYTNHELGFALGLEKHRILICLDDTLPYGLLKDEHGICCSESSVITTIQDIEEAVFKITKYEKEHIDDCIESLCASGNWYDAARRAEKIQDVAQFTKDQINKIANTIICNDQVRTSWDARPILNEILRKHKGVLSDENKSLLESVNSKQ